VGRDGQHGAAAQQLIGPLCLRAWGLHVSVCVFLRAQLETVAAFLAGHHPGDTGPGGSSKGPCAIAGMFGCAPAAASEEYGSVRAQAPLRAPGCPCSSQASLALMCCARGGRILRRRGSERRRRGRGFAKPCPAAGGRRRSTGSESSNCHWQPERVLGSKTEGNGRRFAFVRAARRRAWSESYVPHGPMRCKESTGKGRMTQSVEVEGVATVGLHECRARTGRPANSGDLESFGNGRGMRSTRTDLSCASGCRRQATVSYSGRAAE
jgi:hypothetical protein